MKNLHVLRTADIPPWILLGFWPDVAPRLENILPPSLVELNFGEDDSNDAAKWTDEGIMGVIVEFIAGERWREFTQ